MKKAYEAPKMIKHQTIKFETKVSCNNGVGKGNNRGEGNHH